MVALTGRAEAYYSDTRGHAQEFISAVKYGYLFQGEWYHWQGKQRGEPALDIPPSAFINFLQNHDQVANSALGLRAHLLTSPGRYRAMTALLLLAPSTPMFFQGQEFAASAPFVYFADHTPELAKLVAAGRIEFLSQFPSIADERAQAVIAPPHSSDAFERCKLDFSERQSHRPQYQLTRDLLRMRRSDPAFHAQKPRGVDGAVLNDHAFVLRFFADDGKDKLLIVNLGGDIHRPSIAEPLLAPPSGCRWDIAFATEDPAYGGLGVGPILSNEGWHIAAESALVLEPVDCEEQVTSFHDTKPGSRERIVY
jgi:maltooligosyltrehalose trehalohydrolase